MLTQKEGRILPVEKNLEEGFDRVAQGIAQKMGMSHIPWFKFTYYLTCLYACCTILVMFYREDFFNVNNSL